MGRKWRIRREREVGSEKRICGEMGSHCEGGWNDEIEAGGRSMQYRD